MTHIFTELYCIVKLRKVELYISVKPFESAVKASFHRALRTGLVKLSFTVSVKPF